MEVWDIHKVMVVNLFKVQILRADAEMFRVRDNVLMKGIQQVVWIITNLCCALSKCMSVTALSAEAI